MSARTIRLAVLLTVLATTGARAQEPDPTPAFSLASGHVFSTRERPAISLTFRRVDHLDFRVYRVNEAFAFFEKLRDPHRLGSEAPIVPQERTWLERIAYWKAARRASVRSFVRGQFSRDFRVARRVQQDAQKVVQRQVINVNTFAQVPLLNASQVVTSWREILPPVRDAEYRRVPLELPAAGVYVVEAVNPPLKAYTIVIVSDVGLVTKTAPGQLLMFAANRFSSDPLPDCRVQVLVDQKPSANGTTGADGTYEAALAVDAPDDVVTIAQCGAQVAATDPGAYTIRQPARNLVGYIYSDRPIYRPGHAVRYKSVLRWRERGALRPFDRAPVDIAIADSNQKVLLRARPPVDEFGSITGSFTLPVTASLGQYTISVTRADQTATGTFEVQEYRKPEYDVDVRMAARYALQGNSISATIVARYYFGQPVAGATVKYVMHRQPYYSPLRNEGGEEGAEDGDDAGGWYGGDEQLEGTVRLNDQGTADVSIPLALDEHSRDYRARIEARVTDAGRREVSGASSVVATYGRFMAVARSTRFIYSPGDTAAADLRAIDYEGNPLTGVRLHVALEHVEYLPAASDPRITTLQHADVDSGADGRARWSVTVPAKPGSYRIRVSAPSEGREVSDQTYLWVPGPIDRGVEADDRFLELVADRRVYRPGDTARLIIKGAEFDASVLVTKEHQRIAYHRVTGARGNEAIDVPITDDDVGDVYVSVAFVKDDRLYRAERRLTVPAATHQLTVTATADKAIMRPGEPGVFALRVADSSGAPVRAQISVGLVDEAVYGVRTDTTPDPLRFFYRREYSMVGTSFSRDYPFVGYSGTDQLLLARRRRRPATLADFKAERPDRPRVRKDFPDTIFWAGDVTTDANGAAQIRVEYPDSLTTWRLTARAVTVTTDVGVTTAHTTTTKDLILRVITPRFLTEHDQVTISTIVHNYLPDPKPVSVSLAAGGLTPADPAPPAPSPLQVPPAGQRRVDWRFVASRVQLATVFGNATTDIAGDATALSLPVLPAGLQRNAGGSGAMLDPGERTLTLNVPAAANASARTVRLSLAPSLAGTMLGALDYLTSYPWGCTEQTLSSFVPNLIVMRTLAQLQIAPTARMQALDRQVSDGLKRLYDYQHDDGGWGWWKTDQNHPFMTAYALDGLLQARENGAHVEDGRIFTATSALKRLYAQYPRAIPDLKAYEVHVLARAETKKPQPYEDAGVRFNVAAALDELWSARSRMTASGRALLLMTLDLRNDSRGNTLARELTDAAETRGDVSWWTVASDPLLDDIEDTSVEASALALKALAGRDPRSLLLERVARWLVVNRGAGGYWISTKQTALALHGLLAFMRARGELAAPLSADIFVNDVRVSTATFDARSLAAPDPVRIEAEAVAGANTVRIVKRGAGVLYYDAAVRYYDRPDAAERTGSRRLALTRTYSRLTPVQRNSRVLYHENAFDGTAQPGDLILVRLTTAGSTDWRYLMLEDPIPAGTEPVEQETSYALEGRRTWFWGTHRELRDDRVVFFLNDFTAGRYELTYMLKVTTPGVFGAMPARIAPMYVPDASASTGALTLSVPLEIPR
jgi:uncharacterized protein YfaS (alpha-2-macroglobulin family)